jgi:DNA-binding transcriptional MerR regulator
MREPMTDRLSSWKAIATYLDCSVRTVRRWERTEGLPVHRHVHQKLGRVFALRTEIDVYAELHALRINEQALQYVAAICNAEHQTHVVHASGHIEGIRLGRRSATASIAARKRAREVAAIRPDWDERAQADRNLSLACAVEVGRLAKADGGGKVARLHRHTKLRG